MEGQGKWLLSESAEKERIDIALDLGKMETIKIKTLEELDLLDEQEDSNKILYLDSRERYNLHEYINLMLVLKRRLKKKKKRWKQRHAKACSDPECKKRVPREVDECPECGLDTKWYKTDEKGVPTDIETEKTPPADSIREAHPILHNDASEIVDRAQTRAKKKLIDRATKKNGDEGAIEFRSVSSSG